MANFIDKIKRAFFGRDPTSSQWEGGISRNRGFFSSVPSIRSVVSAAYNRIAVDVAAVDFRHVRLNDKDAYEEDVNSTLNECLKLNPNIDQSRQAFFIDVISSLIDEGCIALFPYETDVDVTENKSFKVYSIRVAKIVHWYAYDVELEVYREELGVFDRIVFPKRAVPIIENPFYEIMNEQNSISKRLLRVLNQLERTNEQNSSGKLDLIIKLPYQIKSAAKRLLSMERRRDLEAQLSDSQLGIGYIDATEQVIQLNRSLDNNLWAQAKDLTVELFNQIGVTEKIINGTASEEEKTNYYDQTIRPFCVAIAEEIERKWLSSTARTQGQAIRFFRDPFKIIPVTKLAELSDKLTRNEILSSNEIRSLIGFKPSKDPRADQLINANLNQDKSDPRQNVKEIEEKERKEDV